MDGRMLAVHLIAPVSDHRRAVGIAGETQGDIYV